MKINRVFLISFLLSILINTALFGFLFRFKPFETAKTVSVNISLEGDLKPTFNSKKGKERLLKKKNKKIDSSHKNRRGFPEKAERKPESKKKRKVYRRDLRKLKVKKENAPENSVKPENRVNQKVLSRVGKNGRPVKEEKREDTGKAGELVSKSKKKEEKSFHPFYEKTAEAVRGKSSTSKGSEVSRKEREDYLKLVLKEIERNKFYPLIARRMGIEGRVKLRVVIGRGGELLSVSVISADSKVLKRAAVKTLKRCHFLPPPGGKFETELTIHYKLR